MVVAVWLPLMYWTFLTLVTVGGNCDNILSNQLSESGTKNDNEGACMSHTSPQPTPIQNIYSNVFERVKEALSTHPNSTLFKSSNIEPILPTPVPTLASPTVYSSPHVSLSSLHFTNSLTKNVNSNPLTQETTHHDINNQSNDRKVCHPSCEDFMEVIKASKKTNIAKDKDKEPLATKLKRKGKLKKKKDKACCLVRDPTKICHNSRQVGKSKVISVGGRSKLNEISYAEFIQAMADYEKPEK
ncbi:hypothetical protein Tco_1189641 [Tanacetum coccineum]